MKYQGKITDPKDLTTKEYVDNADAGLIKNTMTAEATTLSSGSPATVTYDRIANKMSFGIPTGPKGDTGDTGAKGDKGDDGYSPSATVSKSGSTATISITDKTGTTTTTVNDGATGTTFTPSVSTAGVISWTNDGGKQNPPSVNIKGADGQTGADGYSPSASVSKSGTTSTITITDKTGTTTATVNDGAKGDKGDAGSVASITTTGDGNAVTEISLDSTTKAVTATKGASYYLASNPSGYTSNAGTITKVQANGTDIASSGTANIPSATTSRYGVTELVDSVTSTSNALALTANQGKLLNDRINNLASIGKFLALWNATTGLPTTNPTTSPYAYHTGDYYRVTNINATATSNLIPNGASYTTGVASTTHYVPTVAEPNLQVGDVYYYDGTNWVLEPSGGHGTVQDVQVDGTSVVSSSIANVTLDDFGITTTATELNYVAGVTSGIQAQLNTKGTYSKPDDGIPASDLANGVIPTKSSLGLNNVDNTSDATKKTNYTGSIASGNTGFVTGGDAYTALSGKQATLVSGTNIKTINNTTLLGSGNIDVTDIFTVNITVSGGVYTSDKTNAEIYAAFIAGKECRANVANCIQAEFSTITNTYASIELLAYANNKIQLQELIMENNVLTLGTYTASNVSVSDTGTATDIIRYITIDGVEKQIGGSAIAHIL